jgi:carbon-monoxide dehydrogenase large subunit
MVSAFGQSVRRIEDARLLRGRAEFLDDMKPEGVLHVALLRSPLAHARITSVDLDGARTAPGVVAAFGGAEMSRSCAPFSVHVTTPGAIAPDRWPMALDRVRYVGEVIAAVVAGSRYLAEDALELVKVAMDPLPVLSTSDSAMADGAQLVHDNVPRNLYFHGHRSLGDVDEAFRQAGVVVEGEVIHPRVSAAPMEGRGVIAAPDGAGGVVVWSSTQAPHLVADAIAKDFGLDRSAVRVVAPDVGGGFGAKAHVYTEEVLLAWIAMEMKATVKWVEDRSEHLQSSSHARDQRVRFTAAVRNDGRVLGLRATVTSNIGAYGIRPHGPLLDPMTTAGLIPGPYDIRDYEYDTYAVATNRVPMGPYRGVGMVTAVLVHEHLMDLIATTLKLDPVDVRRLNFITREQMPYTAVTGHPYESGDYAAAQKLALDAFDYPAARRERETARAAGRLVGIGLCSYVEFTGAGSSTFKARGMVGISGIDSARVWIDAEGSVRVQTSCPSMGQGSQTTIAQVVADAMEIDHLLVAVEQTDTARVRVGTGSFQSRSSVTAATSAHRAAKKLREEVLNAAAWKLDQPAERLGFSGREITVDGERTGVTLADLAAADPESNGGHTLDVEVEYDPVQASHPYATHACMVEVDRATGAVEVMRYVVADDCGRVINPMVVDGQVRGGIAQGLGAVLLEEISYDSEGQLLSGSFMDYLLPTASEMPSVEMKHMVTPAPMHELGTKGVGEAGTIGSTAALANAISDALGTSACALPFTPERVMALLKSRVEPS